MSGFTVTGKLDKVLDLIQGQSTRGPWKKKEIVVITGDAQYPKPICFTLFNDKVSLIDGIGVGSDIEVGFNVESKEYQGRYFHNVNAWRVVGVNPNAAPAPGGVPQFDPNAYATPTTQTQSADSNDDDDLPF